MASYKIECKNSCTETIKVRLKGNLIKEISFEGGCSPIFQTITLLTTDRNIEEVLELIKKVDLKCVNKETCIEKLIELLERAKVEEEEKMNEEKQYRISLEGFYKNISALYAKPNIKFNLKYVLIKVNPEIYDTIVDLVAELPEYVEKVREETESIFNKEINNIELTDENKKAIKEKWESDKLLFDKMLAEIPEIEIIENDEFNGDYIFNTIYKEND